MAITSRTARWVEPIATTAGAADDVPDRSGTGRAPTQGPRTLWPFISLIPLGLGAWAPILAGVRARRVRWAALGALWCVIVIGGFVGSASPDTDASGVPGLLIICGWTGAVVTSFAIRGAYKRRMGVRQAHWASAQAEFENLPVIGPMPPAAAGPTLWPYWSLLPFGLGAWAPIWAGVRARRARWIALGVLWSAITAVGFVGISHHGKPDAWQVTVGISVALVGWGGAIATSYAILDDYDTRMGRSPAESAVKQVLRVAVMIVFTTPLFLAPRALTELPLHVALLGLAPLGVAVVMYVIYAKARTRREQP